MEKGLTYAGTRKRSGKKPNRKSNLERETALLGAQKKESAQKKRNIEKERKEKLIFKKSSFLNRPERSQREKANGKRTLTIERSISGVGFKAKLKGRIATVKINIFFQSIGRSF